MAWAAWASEPAAIQHSKIQEGRLWRPSFWVKLHAVGNLGNADARNSDLLKEMQGGNGRRRIGRKLRPELGMHERGAKGGGGPTRITAGHNWSF
ncbi:MAG: hypothetical protein JOY90_29140 [Bradyrhizobium sp.]|nr:hypothetical protein [Bradyrhizobium sp.]